MAHAHTVVQRVRDKDSGAAGDSSDLHRGDSASVTVATDSDGGDVPPERSAGVGAEGWAESDPVAMVTNQVVRVAQVAQPARAMVAGSPNEGSAEMAPVPIVRQSSNRSIGSNATEDTDNDQQSMASDGGDDAAATVAQRRGSFGGVVMQLRQRQRAKILQASRFKLANLAGRVMDSPLYPQHRDTARSVTRGSGRISTVWGLGSSSGGATRSPSSSTAALRDKPHTPSAAARAGSGHGTAVSGGSARSPSSVSEVRQRWQRARASVTPVRRVATSSGNAQLEAIMTQLRSVMANVHAIREGGGGDGEAGGMSLPDLLAAAQALRQAAGHVLQAAAEDGTPQSPASV